MAEAKLVIGDTRDVTATMPDGSVDLVLTSPPFLALRSYLPADHPDKHREIGSEATPAAFIDMLLELTAERGRVLAPHGSIAVELGDTYAGSGGAGGDYKDGGLRQSQPAWRGSSSRATAQGGGAAYNGGEGWPLPKSKALIPELYRIALAYGINPLTGAPSPAGRWRVRNVITWCRPNPPVGALGDKYRPATSDLVIATRASNRWFDLDAVRTAYTELTMRVHGKTLKGEPGGVNGPKSANPDGSKMPEQKLTHAGAPPLDYWIIPPGGYQGAHYATFPKELCRIPVLSMCPPFVCNGCGIPLGLNRERHNTMPRMQPTSHVEMGETLLFEDVRESTYSQDTAYDAGMGEGSEGVHPDLYTPAPDGDESRLCDGTPTDRITNYRTPTDAVGSGASHQWGEGRQPPGESGSAGQDGARSETEEPRMAHGPVSALWRVDSGSQPCPRCGSRDLRRGRVFDPFAGTFTAGLVATGNDRDAIGVDLDARNADLAVERLGMFITIEHHQKDAA